MKLLVTDVDGTLVPDGSGVINPEYYEVIHALTEKGYGVVAASGRQYESMRRLFEPVADEMYFISESGGVLWDHGKPQLPKPIPGEYLEEMAADLAKIDGVDYMLAGPKYSYCPKHGTKMYNWLTQGYGFDMIVFDGSPAELPEKITKIAIYDEHDIESKTKGAFYDKWSQKLHLCLAGYMWLDCIMPGINKGSALQALMERLNVAKEDVYAFGDSQNDLEMIQAAGTGYAVLTARPEVIAAADVVIENYEKDGVLTEWKKFLE
jgi:hypothetical protein